MVMGPRILLVRFSAIGDCVMAAWTATSIKERHPDAFLVWAVEGRCAPVIDRHRLVSQRVEFPRDRWRLKKWSPATWREQVLKHTRLRKIGFDFGIDLQGHSKTAICLRVAAPKRRMAAAATDGFAAKLNPVLGDRPAGMHQVEWFQRVLQTMGDFSLPKSPVMPKIPSELDPKLVSISVSAGQEFKAYPLERWQEIARQVVAAGYEVTLLGGRTDTGFEMPGVTNEVGKLRLKDTLSVVARSVAHLAADTGTGHMAAALGTPVVSIFGPTDPAIFRPYATNAVVLRNGESTTSVSTEEVLSAFHGATRAVAV
jgi:hypothetical protein